MSPDRSTDTETAELTDKLAKLNEPQQQRFEQLVTAFDADNVGNGSLRLKHAIVDAIDRNRPKDEFQRVKDWVRREEQGINFRAPVPAVQPPAHEQPATPGAQLQRDANQIGLSYAAQPDIAATQATVAEQMRLRQQAVHAAPAPAPTPTIEQPPAQSAIPVTQDQSQVERVTTKPRDYSELHKTHERVAQEHSLLSMQQLTEISARYAEFQKTLNVTPMTGAIGTTENATKQAPQQAETSPLDQRQRALLDHQQLAERVGVEARSIAQSLRRQQLPGAESYDREALSAFHTGRHVHSQRQQLYREGRTSGGAQPDQQRQTDAQEAVRSGKELSSVQKANAPADVKQRLDGRPRAAADPSTGKASPGRSDPASPSSGPKPSGTTRSGGRSA